MNDFILNNLYLTILLPLWIFLIIMIGRFFSVYVNKLIIYTLSLFASCFGAVLCIVSLYLLKSNTIIEIQNNFIKINDFILCYGLHIDKISLIFGSVLFLISFLVQLYSISYMKTEKKTYKFYALLNLFNFTMIGLFFSPNLFQMYFFWEIATVVSYLLIGFEYFKSIKSFASKKVFIINRIGDTALLGGILLSSYYIYSYANNYHLTTLSFADTNIISTLLYAYTSTPLFWAICILFIIAAIAKSAQVIFYPWLIDAMEAKLPVSALLHSSTLVAAGLFLVIRMIPFFNFDTNILKILIYLGVFTAIICSISACAQTHPKKVLAYSTSAQFGIMFICVGLLDFKAVFAYFIAHAFIKSMLFLTLPKEDEKWNYMNFILFLIGGFSLAGLMLSGLIAKEIIVTPLGNTGTVIFSVISFLTAFYIIRIALVVYNRQGLIKNKPMLLEFMAISGLLILNILFYIYLHKTAQYKIAESFWASFTAVTLVYILFVKQAFWKVPILYPLAINGFYLDKFYTCFIGNIYTKFTNICNNIDTKIFANYKPVIKISKFVINTINLTEKYIMNGYVDFIVKIFKTITLKDYKAQTGNIQTYNIYAFIIITILLICLLIAYLAIINYIGG